MSMNQTDDLSLWWSGEPESVFIFYVTGSLALSFLISLATTYSLRRKQPRVLQLLHNDSVTEPVLTYLFTVTTSSTKGSDCPREAKVFLQVLGLYQSSQMFQVNINLATTSALTQGSTDIFMCKIPETLGPLKGLKFLLCGLTVPKIWKISKAASYVPSTGAREDLTVEVLVTEILSQPSSNLNNQAVSDQSMFMSFVHILAQYHQWTSAVVNTVRFGAYTEVVHVLLLFLNLLLQLCLCLIFYISLTRAGDRDSFSLNMLSFLLAGTMSACISGILTFTLQLLIWQVQCKETNPGPAYCKIKAEKRLTSLTELTGLVKKKQDIPVFESAQKPLFVLSSKTFIDNPDKCLSSENLAYLKSFLEGLQDTISSKPSRQSNLGTESSIISLDVDLRFGSLSDILLLVEDSALPSFSKLCLQRIISRQSSKTSVNRSKQSLTGFQHPTSAMTTPIPSSFLLSVQESSQDLDDFDLFKSALDMPGLQLYSMTIGRDWVQYPRTNLEWQQMQKQWSRSFTQNLIHTTKEFREQLLCGTVSLSMIVTKMIGWLGEVCHRITMATTVISRDIEQDVAKDTELLKLYGHVSLDVLVCSLENLHRVLYRHDIINLPDIIMLSHDLTRNIQHAALTAISFVQAEFDWQQYQLIRKINPSDELQYAIGVYLSRCFQLSVKFDDNTWAYFQTLVHQVNASHPYLPVSDLLRYIDLQLGQESELDIVVRRLCNLVEHDARDEVWTDLTEQQHVFTKMLIRHQVLEAMQGLIRQATRRKQRLGKKYDLIPEKRKSRIKKLIEKRHNLKKGDTKKVKLDVPVSVEELERATEEFARLGKYVEMVTRLQDEVRVQWTRQGLRPDLNPHNLLVKSFLHPRVQVMGCLEDSEKAFKFDNFLCLKRTEKRVSELIKERIKDATELLMDNILSGQSLDPKDTRWLDVAIQETLAKIDFQVEMLGYNMDDILSEVFAKEMTSGDQDSCQMTLKHSQSGQPSTKNVSAVIQAGNSKDKEQVPGDKIIEERTMMVFVNEQDGKQSTETSSIKDMQEMTESSVIKDIKSELLPLKQKLERSLIQAKLVEKVSLLGYLEHQSRKRARLCDILLNTVVDAPYALDSLDYSHTLTQAGLYQLEHDVTGHVDKPLSGWVRTVVIRFSLLVIAWCLVYSTLVGGQLTTSQNQEFVCYFLLSVLLWGIFVEPLKVTLLLLGKKI